MADDMVLPFPPSPAQVLINILQAPITTAPPAKKPCGKKPSRTITPLLRTVKGKRVDASQVAAIVETFQQSKPTPEPRTDQRPTPARDAKDNQGNNSKHTGAGTSNMDNTTVTGGEQQPQIHPRKVSRPGRGSSKGAPRAQTPGGQRRSARHKKRSAIVLENDWLAAEEMLTAHIAAATKAAKDRRAAFHSAITNESPVRKLSLHVVWLKLTPAGSNTDASHLLL